MQLVMLTSRQNLTISLGVATMLVRNGQQLWLDHGRGSLAAAIVTVFLVFQKSTQGITMGAVKG